LARDVLVDALMMKRTRTLQIGDVVAAAFDHAERWSTDPAQVSRLATAIVKRILGRAPRARGRIQPAGCR
jgi:hypothetical protein